MIKEVIFIRKQNYFNETLRP